MGKGGGLLVAGALLITSACASAQVPERIVYVSDRDGNREIYSSLLDGSDPRNLSENPARDQAPTVSADGRSIAFLSDRTGPLGVWVMARDGSDPRMVAETPDADFGLDWSPDGRLLAMTIQRPGQGTHDIGLLELETGEITLLTDTETVEDVTPTWSPAGEHLYYVQEGPGGSRLIEVDVSGARHRVAVDHMVGEAAFPTISPDGRFALIRSRLEGQFDVLLIDLATSGATNLTPDPANDWGAVWSRDGESIAFASDRDGDMEIYLLELSSGELTQVTRNESRDWMPAR